jgi:hypothetical protein
MQWISVKERLPDLKQKVLGFNSSADFFYEGPYFVLTYYGNYWNVDNDTYPNGSNFSNFEPTHWMSLPESPEDKD